MLKSNNQVGLTQLSARFSSVEEYNQLMEYWRLSFVQLDGGQYHSQLNVLQTKHVTLNRVSFNKRLWQQGEPPSNMMTFGLRASAGPEMLWNKQIVTPQTLELFNSHEGFEITSPPGFDAFTIALPNSLLKGLAERE